MSEFRFASIISPKDLELQHNRLSELGIDKLLSMGKITPDQVREYESVLGELYKNEQIEKERMVSTFQKSIEYASSIIGNLRRQLGALYPLLSNYAQRFDIPKHVNERNSENIFNMAGFEFDHDLGRNTFKNLHNNGVQGHRINPEGLSPEKLEQRVAGKILPIVSKIKLEEETTVKVLRTNGSIDGFDKGWVIDNVQTKQSLLFGEVVVVNRDEGIKKSVPINVLEGINPQLFEVAVKRSNGDKESGWNIREVFTKDNRQYVEVVNHLKGIKKVIDYDSLLEVNPKLKGEKNNESIKEKIQDNLKLDNEPSPIQFKSSQREPEQEPKPVFKDDSKIPANDVYSKYRYHMSDNQKVISQFDKKIERGDILLIETAVNMKKVTGAGTVIGVDYDGAGNYLVEMRDGSMLTVDMVGIDGVIVRRS